MAMYKFKTEPYEHQKNALKKCWNKEAFAIFAEMGTGKLRLHWIMHAYFIIVAK